MMQSMVFRLIIQLSPKVKLVCVVCPPHQQIKVLLPLAYYAVLASYLLLHSCRNFSSKYAGGADRCCSNEWNVKKIAKNKKRKQNNIEMTEVQTNKRKIN